MQNKIKSLLIDLSKNPENEEAFETLKTLKLQLENKKKLLENGVDQNLAMKILLYASEYRFARSDFYKRELDLKCRANCKKTDIQAKFKDAVKQFLEKSHVL